MFVPPETSGESAFELLPVEGITEPIQFFRVSLMRPPAEEIESHFVLSAYTRPISEERRRAIGAACLRRFPGAAVCFIVNNREGWARVSTEHPTAEAAAAVATVKVCGGWDESNPIVIELGRGAFAVRFFLSTYEHFWKVEVDCPPLD